MLAYLKDISKCYKFCLQKFLLLLIKNKDLNSNLLEIPQVLLFHLITETYIYQVGIYLKEVS